MEEVYLLSFGAKLTPSCSTVIEQRGVELTSMQQDSDQSWLEVNVLEENRFFIGVLLRNKVLLILYL